MFNKIIKKINDELTFLFRTPGKTVCFIVRQSALFCCGFAAFSLLFMSALVGLITIYPVFLAVGAFFVVGVLIGALADKLCEAADRRWGSCATIAENAGY